MTLCVTLRAFSGYRRRVFVQNFLKATKNADSSSRVGQPGICRSTGPSCRLLLTGFLSTQLSSPDWPVLSTGLFCSLLLTVSFSLLWDLPSSTSGLVGDLAHKSFVWVSRQNRQRDPLTNTHTHWNECHPSCQNTVLLQWFRILISPSYLKRLADVKNSL